MSCTQINLIKPILIEKILIRPSKEAYWKEKLLFLAKKLIYICNNYQEASFGKPIGLTNAFNFFIHLNIVVIHPSSKPLIVMVQVALKICLWCTVFLPLCAGCILLLFHKHDPLYSAAQEIRSRHPFTSPYLWGIEQTDLPPPHSEIVNIHDFYELTRKRLPILNSNSIHYYQSLLKDPPLGLKYIDTKSFQIFFHQEYLSSYDGDKGNQMNSDLLTLVGHKIPSVFLKNHNEQNYESIIQVLDEEKADALNHILFGPESNSALHKRFRTLSDALVAHEMLAYLLTLKNPMGILQSRHGINKVSLFSLLFDSPLTNQDLYPLLNKLSPQQCLELLLQNPSPECTIERIIQIYPLLITLECLLIYCYLPENLTTALHYWDVDELWHGCLKHPHLSVKSLCRNELLDRASVDNFKLSLETLFACTKSFTDLNTEMILYPEFFKSLSESFLLVQYSTLSLKEWCSPSGRILRQYLQSNQPQLYAILYTHFYIPVCLGSIETEELISKFVNLVEEDVFDITNPFCISLRTQIVNLFNTPHPLETSIDLTFLSFLLTRLTHIGRKKKDAMNRYVDIGLWIMQLGEQYLLNSQYDINFLNRALKMKAYLIHTLEAWYLHLCQWPDHIMAGAPIKLLIDRIRAYYSGHPDKNHLINILVRNQGDRAISVFKSVDPATLYF